MGMPINSRVEVSMPGELDAFMKEVWSDSVKAGKGAVEAYRAFGAYFRLSRQVLALRQSHRWTQQALAKRSGVQQSAISRIERGESNPTLETLAALATAF